MNTHDALVQLLLIAFPLAVLSLINSFGSRKLR